MSQRSNTVQAGRMTSANTVSPSHQTDWFTTNFRLSCWYALIQRFEATCVPIELLPYL